jgi:hypothetical protein
MTPYMLFSVIVSPKEVKKIFYPMKVEEVSVSNNTNICYLTRSAALLLLLFAIVVFMIVYYGYQMCFARRKRSTL